ncbi:MAG: hypothetical protein WC730_00925 [Patescibacteria group bacterium]|jgi:hypothetical protein
MFQTLFVVLFILFSSVAEAACLAWGAGTVLGFEAAVCTHEYVGAYCAETHRVVVRLPSGRVAEKMACVRTVSYVSHAYVHTYAPRPVYHPPVHYVAPRPYYQPRPAYHPPQVVYTTRPHWVPTRSIPQAPMVSVTLREERRVASPPAPLAGVNLGGPTTLAQARVVREQRASEAVASASSPQQTLVVMAAAPSASAADLESARRESASAQAEVARLRAELERLKLERDQALRNLEALRAENTTLVDQSREILAQRAEYLAQAKLRAERIEELERRLEN